MKLFASFPITLALATLATPYKIRSFNKTSCEGESKVVNVWDNTCRDHNVMGTRSFEVLAYGAFKQKAFFYSGGHCVKSYGEEKRIWWADGGSTDFKKGGCVDVGFEANAFGSQSG